MSVFLKTITLYNFKSFRGEIIIGPIEPFTAIIGPNGTGKSNIMDALSFVLGQKSSTLRVKRLNELIHGASIGKPTAQSTYVTAVFVVDDNKEQAFTRMICGDNSQFQIDNKTVTSDIYMSKLREYGLDVKSGHFMIYQGDIECIAMKTPKEQTEMFEQISGSNVYKANYDRLKMEFSKAEDEVQFVYQMKKQLLMHKKCTGVEKAEAVKYMKLQKQYVEEKSKLQLIRLLIIKRVIRNLIGEETKIKSQLNDNLHDKEVALCLLENKKLQLKPLFHSFDITEQSIIKIQDIIQEKQIQYDVLNENISHCQRRRNCTYTSLDSASKAHDANEKTIQELRSELEQVFDKLKELEEALQQSTVELSDSQVKHYVVLKNKAEYQAKDFIKQINDLIHDQQAMQNKLDNKTRQQQELQDKIKQKIFKRNQLEKHLEKLQTLSSEFNITLEDKIIKKQQLNDKIIEVKNKSLSLENDLRKISEELRDALTDSYTTTVQIKKSETMKILKEYFTGVHGRLSNLCKPIHSRYNIAITKVFGKNMDAIVVDTMHVAKQCIYFLKQQKIDIETFLPLDSLKPIILKEKLRDIKEPRNIKLLYDVLDISFIEINAAVLFVTKNTLVCESAEDARLMAYNMDKHNNHDCVSLDGCFYHKNGTISGGYADLLAKAKRWNQHEISALKEQKMLLIQELQNLPKIIPMQSELDIVDIQIKGFVVKEKYAEKDLKDTEDEIVKLSKESVAFDVELSLLNKAILEVQYDVQEKDNKIKTIEKHITEIKNEIFIDFCKDINVSDISYYEKNNLRAYQEQKQRLMDYKKQYDCIENQLHYENERDTKSKILKWKCVIEQLDAKLNVTHQQVHLAEIAIKKEEIKLSELQNTYKSMKQNLEELEKELGECRSQIGVISKLYLESQKMYIAIQRKMEQKKIEYTTILKNCKIEDIIVPMLAERHRRSYESSQSTSTESLSLNNWEMLMDIDFSQFPENIRNGTEEELQHFAKQLEEKVMNIQSDFESIANPNLKADEKMNSVVQQIQDINMKLQELRKNSNKIKMQFETIKAKRHKLFSACLERVSAEIDTIYKNLVNDISAQAFILPDNPEEPYAGGINYSCIAPYKRFQPLQHLSGGEKSLASLALLFAIYRYKPAPFFIVDEGDAALDKTNIKNIVRFIRSEMNTMQFLIITLQKSLYFCADALVGITSEPDARSPESTVFAISLNGYRTSK